MSDQQSTGRESWPLEVRRDFEATQFNGCVGQVLLSESDKVRVWSLSLKPGERCGFHRHVLNYFWTALSDGRSRSRYNDGRIVEAEYRKGDTRHLTFGAGEFMVHDLENIGDTVLSYTTVEFLDSPNKPLPIPAHVYRDGAKAA